MLDRDDLLPEEQVNAEFLQKLQTIYQMNPQEKEALVRVQERLAQRSRHLSEPVKVGEPARSLRLVSQGSSATQPARLRQRWLQPFNSLAVVLCVVLLVGALVLTFSMISRSTSGTTRGNAIRLLLVPAENGVVLSQAELTMIRTILSERFNSFGLQGASVQAKTTNGHPGILVELPYFGGNEKLIVNTLLVRGVLEFWDTGPIPVNVETMFDPGQYTQYNPSGRPPFLGSDLDPNQTGVGQDPQTSQIVINFEMKGTAISRFADFTGKHIGDYLTVTLDRKVISSAVIQSAIDGPAQIPGSFTLQQAKAIVAAFRYGSLPVGLKQQGP